MQKDTNIPSAGTPNNETVTPQTVPASQWAEPVEAHHPGAFTPPNAVKPHKGLKIGLMVGAAMLVVAAIAVPVALVVKGNENDKLLQGMKTDYMSGCLASASAMMTNSTISRNVNAQEYCECSWSTLVATVGKDNLAANPENITMGNLTSVTSACAPMLEL
ncbi:MAG: hypothetical protein LBQ02_00030 [Candidatus Nomurabacteria bacterium]|jgi:hypothetical protein|nr:hypothetical protein [Candidatus Nomurabacteria bacterium]